MPSLYSCKYMIMWTNLFLLLSFFPLTTDNTDQNKKIGFIFCMYFEVFFRFITQQEPAVSKQCLEDE